MPFKSKAQERYFNANRAKMEAQGVNVEEWNASSKGKSLPERAGIPLGESTAPKKKVSRRK